MWHQVAAVAGASGVALGAYGAHGLSGKSDKIKKDWATATQYQLLHAVALATLPTFQRTGARTASGILFSAGITLFSGSIYAYVLTDQKKITGAAPVGGIALILGWASMAFLKR